MQRPPGLSGYVIVQKASTVAPPAGGAMLIITCPVGKKVLGGGFSGASWDVNTSMPSSEDKWIFTGKNLGSTNGPFSGYAVCATVAP